MFFANPITTLFRKSRVDVMGYLDKSGKISVAVDAKTFKDCKTGKYYRMRRINGVMVISEIPDERDDQREVDILSSVLSVLHNSERRRSRDEKDTIISVDHRSLDDAAHDPLGKRSNAGRGF